MSPNFYFVTAAQASGLLPVIVGIRNYRLLSPAFRLLLYFLVLSIGFDIQGTILKQFYSNNMPGLHLYTLVEFLAFSAVYYSHFQKNSALQLFIGINAIVFVAVCLADAFWINNIWSLNPLSRSYSSVSMIFYTLVYFFFMFRKDTESYSMTHPMFWVNIALLIYFGFNTLYFMLGHWMMKHKEMAFLGLFLHNTMNIVANCLFAQSFRCFRIQKAVS